jgi:hypothetical protein
MPGHGFLPDEKVIAGIRQEIARYEAERVAAHRQVMWRVPLFLGLLLLAVIALAWAFNRIADVNEQWSSAPHIFLYFGGLALAFFLYSRAHRPADRLQQSFRSRVLPTVFGFIHNVRYGKGVTPESFDRLPKSVVGEFDRQSFDDVVAGTYGGFPFELYEATLKDKAGKSTITRFHGVVMAFENERPFPGLLVATRKANQVMSFFRDLFGKSVHEIASGVPEIDERYEFQTDNTEAAMPLVRGRMAQALQWLAESWPGEPARIALRGADGFLLLPTPKNFFELPPISTPLDYGTHIEPIIADMASLIATASLVRKVSGEGDEAGQ